MNTNSRAVEKAIPKYLIVKPSSYSILKMVERNKAVNISEIIIAIAFTVTKNNFLTNVPSKHNRAISKHKNTVTAIFAANGKNRLVLKTFSTTAAQK